MARMYNQLLEKYPIPTKTLTSGTLFSLGDALTQLCIFPVIKLLKRNHNSAGKETSISSLLVSDILHQLYMYGIVNGYQHFQIEYFHQELQKE